MISTKQLKWIIAVSFAAAGTFICIGYPHFIHWMGWAVATAAIWMFYNELERHERTLSKFKRMRGQYQDELQEHQETLDDLHAARRVIHRLHEALEEQEVKD